MINHLYIMGIFDRKIRKYYRGHIQSPVSLQNTRDQPKRFSMSRNWLLKGYDSVLGWKIYDNVQNILKRPRPYFLISIRFSVFIETIYDNLNFK